MVTAFRSVDDVMVALQLIEPLTSAEDVKNSAELQQIIDRTVGSSIELDAIMLIVRKVSRFNDELTIWTFYQNIIMSATDQVGAAFTIGEACAYHKGQASTLAKHNITRLLYRCADDLILRSETGHSSMRIGCARVFVRIGQLQSAAWFLWELNELLRDLMELRREAGSLANNELILRELAASEDEDLRDAAGAILEAAALG